MAQHNPLFNFLNDKRVKYPLFVLIWFFVAFMLMLFGKAACGHHVKFLGFEMNEPKPDTVVRTIQVPVDTSAKINKPINSPLIIPTTTSKKELPQTKKEIPGINQTNKNGNNEANQNTGNNSGNMGGQNNTVNNLGIIPRKISEAELLPFLNQLPNKDVEFHFISYGFADAEINSVRSQIIVIAKKHGFKNFSPSFFVQIGVDPPPAISLQYFDKQNIFEIKVPPANL